MSHFHKYLKIKVPFSLQSTATINKFETVHWIVEKLFRLCSNFMIFGGSVFMPSVPQLNDWTHRARAALCYSAQSTPRTKFHFLSLHSSPIVLTLQYAKKKNIYQPITNTLYRETRGETFRNYKSLIYTYNSTNYCTILIF